MPRREEGLARGGCVTADGRPPPSFQERAVKDTGLRGKNEGKGTVPKEPAGAFCSALPSGPGHHWRRVQWGPGPSPPSLT